VKVTRLHALIEQDEVVGFTLFASYAVIFEDVDYIAPGQPELPFHLMFLRAVRKYGMQHWLRQRAVHALLVEGYGENPDSWFVRHALEVRQRARQASQRSLTDARK
jgi:hypothetical protein